MVNAFFQTYVVHLNMICCRICWQRNLGLTLIVCTEDIFTSCDIRLWFGWNWILKYFTKPPDQTQKVEPVFTSLRLKCQKILFSARWKKNTFSLKDPILSQEFIENPSNGLKLVCKTKQGGNVNEWPFSTPPKIRTFNTFQHFCYEEDIENIYFFGIDVFIWCIWLLRNVLHWKAC